MEERNLTKAARRLGMSQPAVSHSLARLRYMLKDELFVRSPEGMNPTPLAERIAEPVRAALRELQVTLEADEFVAADSSREFTIAANNYAARAVIPALVHRVASLAPSVVLDVRPIGLRNVLDQLDDGAVELALTTLVEGSDRFKCAALLEDDYVATLASNHPEAAKPELSIERFSALPHICITSSGDDEHFVDDALSERGLARLVSMKAPLHSVVSLLLTGSQAVAMLPRRVAEDLAAHCPLAVRALPFPSPRITLSMVWRRRLDNHPAHRWLRDTLRSSSPRRGARSGPAHRTASWPRVLRMRLPGLSLPRRGVVTKTSRFVLDILLNPCYVGVSPQPRGGDGKRGWYGGAGDGPRKLRLNSFGQDNAAGAHFRLHRKTNAFAGIDNIFLLWIARNPLKSPRIGRRNPN
jgi:DNA-binding transcriptional LysR family regulator